MVFRCFFTANVHKATAVQFWKLDFFFVFISFFSDFFSTFYLLFCYFASFDCFSPHISLSLSLSLSVCCAPKRRGTTASVVSVPSSNTYKMWLILRPINHLDHHPQLWPTKHCSKFHFLFLPVFATLFDLHFFSERFCIIDFILVSFFGCSLQLHR